MTGGEGEPGMATGWARGEEEGGGGGDAWGYGGTRRRVNRIDKGRWVGMGVVTGRFLGAGDRSLNHILAVNLM